MNILWLDLWKYLLRFLFIDELLTKNKIVYLIFIYNLFIRWMIILYLAGQTEVGRRKFESMTCLMDYEYFIH